MEIVIRDLEVLEMSKQLFSPTTAVMIGLTNVTGKRATQLETMLGDGNKAIFDNILPAALAYQQGGCRVTMA